MPSSTSSHTLGVQYVRSPICAIASYPPRSAVTTATSSREDGAKSYAIVAAGGGAASTGVKNSLIIMSVTPGADAAEGVSFREESRLDLGPVLVEALSISPEGDYLAAVSGRNCSIYRCALPSTSTSSTSTSPKLEFVATFVASREPSSTPSASSRDDEEKANISCISFSTTGRHVAMADSLGRIMIWDISTIVSLHRKNNSITTTTTNQSSHTSPVLLATVWGHTARILTVAFDTKGQSLISSSTDGSSRVWDVSSLVVPSSSSSSSTHLQIQCHILPAIAPEEIGTKFMSASNKKRFASASASSAPRWQCKGAVMSSNGKSAFILESNPLGGAIVSKWRCSDNGGSSSSKYIAKKEFVYIDGRKAGSSASSSSSSSLSSSTTDASFWYFAVHGVASKAGPLTGICGNSVTYTNASTQAIEATEFDRIALNADGGVVYFDTETMHVLWKEENLGGGLTITAASFLFQSHQQQQQRLQQQGMVPSIPHPDFHPHRPVYVLAGSLTGQLALLSAAGEDGDDHRHSVGARVVRTLVRALLFLLFVSLAFIVVWLVMAARAKQHPWYWAEKFIQQDLLPIAHEWLQKSKVLVFGLGGEETAKVEEL